MTGIDLVKAAVRALDEKKAEDIEVIQITELSVVADYFVIANGTSNTHVRALASEVEDALSKQGVEAGHIKAAPRDGFCRIMAAWWCMYSTRRAGPIITLSAYGRTARRLKSTI